MKFIPEDDVKVSEVNYNPDAMNEVIASFSSPVEMAALLKDSDVEFSKRYLLEPDKVKNYSSSYKKALGLGVLSADLGYLNVYNQTSEILDYLVSIRRLTDDLQLSQFFDFHVLKRLATSDDNVDSLLIMSVQSYQNMDEHLRMSKRSNMSALLVTGVWLESFYLVTQVAKEKPSQQFRETIGEQKNILNNLLPILKLFKDQDEFFDNLVLNMLELKEVLDVVSIETSVVDKGEKRDDGVIEQNEYSIVTVSDEELLEIILTAEKVRNKIINN
ncbi:MAG: hypothetical protein MJZ61_00315 [Bacteroidales bacterium]|nr:hypothetical protein [Bacteroidales bacterium]